MPLNRRRFGVSTAAGLVALGADVPVARDRNAAIKAARDAIAPAFARFEPNDWSRNHPEERFVSLEAYIASKPNRPRDGRTTIYLQPIGDLTRSQRRVATAVGAALRYVFALPVKELPPVVDGEIPDRARRVHPEWGDRQLLTKYLLNEVLLRRRPQDAVAVLALTTEDLWPGENWNFVFGQASLRERVGVWSLYRYGDPDRDAASYHRYLVRALKVATHEAGHMLGIPHCIAYACGMNGSNSLPETDAAPLPFCPECSAKIWWATGAQPAAWLRSLRDFAESHSLDDAQTTWSEALLLLAAR